MKVLCGITEKVVETGNHVYYRNGDFSIRKRCEDWYDFLWKKVVIHNFTGVNKELADQLATKSRPEKCWPRYLYDDSLTRIKKVQTWKEFESYFS